MKSTKYPAILMLTLTMLASGCSETPFSPGGEKHPPQIDSELGLVKVTISGIGTDQMSASAYSVGSRTAYNLTEPTGTTGGDGTIQIEAVSNGSFTTGSRTDGTGMRYLFATFNVRNAQSNGDNYDTPRENLTFMGVDNGTTLGHTAVVELRLFDGTPLTDPQATNMAKTIIPTGNVANIGGAVVPAKADVLQIITETEAGAITVQAGVDVFPYGFITSSPGVTPGSRQMTASPAAGQYEGIVTFAFKIPLQAQAKHDPFEITMMFLPVDDDETRITQSLEEQSHSGTAAFLKRANFLNATTQTLLPPNNLLRTGDRRFICSVRTAGPAGSPTAQFPVSTNEQWLVPGPFLSGSSFLPKAVRIGVAGCPQVTAADINTFSVHGSQSGRATGTYSGSGTPLYLAPAAPGGDFFPGEVVEVTLNSATTGSNPVTARYRIKTVPSSGTYSSETKYLVGTKPIKIISADFDNNGNIDLAVTNSASDSISVLMGNGDGTFDDDSMYKVGNTPKGIITSDFDVDGDLDLIAVNEDSDNISVLKGNGDGTFANHITYDVGNAPGSITAGDFDGDGYLDIAVTNKSSDNVSILMNNGDGTFANNKTVTVGNYPWGITAGDFDMDGDIDLAVANHNSDNVSILIGIGNGTFSVSSTYSVCNYPMDITAGEFDGDSKPDLVIICGIFSTGDFKLLSGNGNGSFTTTFTDNTWRSPYEIVPGDLDGDGDLDFAFVSFQGSRIIIHMNAGDGTFADPVSYNAGIAMIGITAADFDNDGDLDLAGTNKVDTSISVVLNQ